jgi:hypothetical protein
MRHTSKHMVRRLGQKRFIGKPASLSEAKASAPHSIEPLAPWLALADAALTGSKTTLGRGIATNQIDAAAVIEILRARSDFPAVAKAIGARRDFTEAESLGHKVAQIIHALANGEPVGSAPVAAFRRDGGRVNIYFEPARSKRGKETATVVVSGFEAVDFFLSAVEGINARRVRRCELEECARFFWAIRSHSRGCCPRHTALCRLRRYRAKSKGYEQRRKEKLALGL